MDNVLLTDPVAVIIAGGQSRRMGGIEKCLVKLADTSPLEIVIERLRGQVEHIAINNNGDPSWFKQFRLPVIPDTHFPQAGPLAGVVNSLSWMQSQYPSAHWLLTIPGDTPFIPLDLAQRLVDLAEQRKTDVFYATCGQDRHYLTALWSTSIFTQLMSFLEAGGRSVNRFLAGQNTETVAFNLSDEGDDPFFNINTPEDLVKAEAILTKGKIP